MTTHRLATDKKPLRCRLGLHQWYSDGAMIYSAYRCNYCNDYRDKHEGELLELARRILDEECDRYPHDFTKAIGAAHVRFARESIVSHRHART